MTDLWRSVDFDAPRRPRDHGVTRKPLRSASGQASFRFASLLLAACGGLATGAGLAAFLAFSSAPEISSIDRVLTADIDAAAPSLLGSTMVAAVNDAKSCRRPLASVVVQETNPEGGLLRFRSGDYVSPKIRLGKNPFKLALPLPAPFEAGAGKIFVESETTGVAVLLTPGVMIPSGTRLTTLNVTWKTAPSCQPSG